MLEILPVKLLTEEDSPIFGSLALALGKLAQSGTPVANCFVATAPALKLKTTLEYFDFGERQVFEQSLTLVKKELEKTPVPEILQKELRKHNRFFLKGEKVRGVKNLWLKLLDIWLEQIRDRLWREGFYKGLTEGLEPQIVVLTENIESFGSAFFDPLQDDVVVNNKGKNLHPADIKKIVELVKEANKKLFIPHEYRWVLDKGIKLSGVLLFTPGPLIPDLIRDSYIDSRFRSPREAGGNDKEDGNKNKSTVKMFLDLSTPIKSGSTGLVIEREIDGIFIASEKIFDLNKPRESFEDMLFRLVESAITFEGSPILFKLADKSEGPGGIRGTLRLLHQRNLLNPMLEALDFIRHKRRITNVHIVIPFVRGINEFLQIKRELAVKKLGRKNSLKLWLELAVPENIINLEEYLLTGLDGVVLNLDELSSHLGGYDYTSENIAFYKHEVSGLLKFLEDGLKLLHKSKIPFISFGSLSLNPTVLEFLVEIGVYGIVAERYEAPSAKEQLHNMEKRLILRRTS